jgi:hypothetical protein
MTTIKEWLTGAGFDWETGKIIWQQTNFGDCPGWSYPIAAYRIESDHSILGQEFNCGFGGPECPRFIAKDSKFIYFPAQYDGSTWIEKVAIDIDFCLDHKNSSPYPGG